MRATRAALVRLVCQELLTVPATAPLAAWARAVAYLRALLENLTAPEQP